MKVLPAATLADTLRFQLGLTGTKVVCDRGACTACTVHLDGTPVCSCMTLAVDVGTRSVTTIEGLAEGDKLTPIQEQFIANDAMQCGFCTPGMVMSCAALLAQQRAPVARRRQDGGLRQPLPLRHLSEGVRRRRWPPRDGKAPPGTQVVDARGRAARRRSAKLEGRAPRRRAAAVADERQAQGRRQVAAAHRRARSRSPARRATPPTCACRACCSRGAWSSPHPHARVKAIDTSRRRAAAGREGGARRRAQRRRQAAQSAQGAPRSIRSCATPGRPWPAVAATTQAIADEAATLVKVDYEPLPFVVDLDDARKDRRAARLSRPGRHGRLGRRRRRGQGAAAERQRARPVARATSGDVDAGLASGRLRRRGRVPHAGADALGARDPRRRRRLEARRPDRLRLDARRPPSVRDELADGVRPAQGQGPRHHRVHGRRLRRQVRRRQPSACSRRTCRRRRARRCGSCSIARRSTCASAIARRRCRR